MVFGIMVMLCILMITIVILGDMMLEVFAWDNTELASNMWLWYNFLRTGRADIWCMAEAMTRHTSEVDVYHIGPNAGLGSRHNVSHWGMWC